MVTEYDKLVIGEFHHKEGMKEGLEKGLKKGIEIGREAGMAEGREVGKAETQRELVLRMREKGMDEETIADLVGLSLEKIRDIA